MPEVYGILRASSKKGDYLRMGNSPRTMAELLAAAQVQIVVPKKGDTVTGKIVSKEKRTMVVDLGAKTEGIVSDKEFDFATDFIKDLKAGDSITAVVISSENDRGQVILSLKNAASDAKWEYFEKAMETEEILEAKGLEVNRGGLIVVVNGVRGFVPSSQFGRAFVGKIQQLKAASFKVKAIEVDREKNRLIFSERHVSEAKELAQKDMAVKKVEIGGTYEGVVSGVMHFGLFVTVEIPVDGKAAPEAAAESTETPVEKTAETTETAEVAEKPAAERNVGYVEGLIHISEISWEKVNHPKDYHKIGDRLKVRVLGIDEKTGKLNLSIKQLQQDPWQKIAESYSIGTTFTGKVTRIESFGAFVNVEPGVDGLIHASKLDPSRDLKAGDEVTVNVESVSPEQRRMSLSMVLTEVPMGYK